MKKVKSILTTLVLVFTLASFAQESVLLRLNYKKGDSYLLKMDMKQDMGIMKMDMKMHLKTDVITVNNGAFNTKNQFVKIAMDMEAQGQEIHYDSDAKEEEMDDLAKGMHAEMKPLKETIILITYDALGNVTESKIEEGKSNIEAFKENMTSFVLPKQEVSVGSTWNNEKTSTKGVKMEYIYKVTAIKEKEVLLDVSGKISELATGNITGTAVLDRETGTLSNMELKLNMEMMGMSVKSEITTIVEKL